MDIKLFLIFSVLLPSSIIGQSTDIKCNYEGHWVASGDRCYKLIDEYVTKSVAEEICRREATSEGPSFPSLLTIPSEKEQTLLTDLFFRDWQIPYNIWLAATRVNNSQTFVWSDGTNVDYNNWAGGNPSNDSTLGCAQINSRFAKGNDDSVNVEDGLWIANACSRHNVVVCQRPQSWSNQLVTATLQQLVNNPVPIGFIYVELPYQPNPHSIWSNVVWEDITSSYAGLFFRAEGDDSAVFGEPQGDNSPRFTNASYSTNPGAASVSVTPDVWSPWLSTGVAVSGYPGSIRFFVSGGEVRPKNTAIHIWKRIR